MVRRFGDKMAKSLLVIFNFLFLVCGIGICVLSLRGIPHNYNEFINALSNVNYVFLAVGVAIALMAFLGCCGALSENKCMVTLFILLLTGILVAEIAIGGVAFAKRSDIEGVVKDAGLKMMNSTEKASTDVIDDIQSSLKCCGMDGPGDYDKIDKPIRASCCGSRKDDETCTMGNPHLHKDGCYPKIVDKIKSHLLYVGLAAMFVTFIEVVGIIFACCLRGAIAERYESV